MEQREFRLYSYHVTSPKRYQINPLVELWKPSHYKDHMLTDTEHTLKKILLRDEHDKRLGLGW